MSRGTKLDLSIGADFDDGWAQVQSPRRSQISDEILEPSKHFLLFKKEKRRGKTVTIVGAFSLPKTDSSALVTRLKKKLGCGGKYTENWMEFQGECKEKLRELLGEEGFRFRQGH